MSKKYFEDIWWYEDALFNLSQNRLIPILGIDFKKILFNFQK